MNIKEMRIETGQTQKEFAGRFGIPIGTLRRWEYGESTPAPYILKLIAEQLPIQKEHCQKIESTDGIFYYDKMTKTVEDIKGTKIKINGDLESVKKQNLSFYLESLFDEYYEAVSKFDRECRLDKQEDILWG